MKIAFTGGGTGGHVFPLIAVARKIQEQAPRDPRYPLELFYFGPVKNSAEPFQQSGMRIYNVLSGKFRRYFSFATFIDIPKLCAGFFQAYWYLWRFMPDLVFSKGGYGSIPVVVVAWLFRVPVVIHESDRVAGLTNRLLARLSKRILVSFPGEYPEFPAGRPVVVGNPVRDLRGMSPDTARAELKIQTRKPTLFITGGSQGALQLNTLVLAVLDTLTQKYEVIHQTGDKNYEAVLRQMEGGNNSARASYHPYPFLEERQLQAAFSAADIVISRAGAGAVFEIALMRKPSILIPLERSAANHQQKNAITYEKSGACVVLSPRNVTPHILMNEIDELINDPAERSKMAEAAGTFAKPEAAGKIAEIIITYVKNVYAKQER